MDILENEFTEIARLRARGNVVLSLGTLEVYLFIVRIGMKVGGFRGVEAQNRLFERQGVSRRRLARAVAELAAAGLLEREAGSGATPTRYTLPRLAGPAPVGDAPQARSTANDALPLAPGGCGPIPAGGAAITTAPPPGSDAPKARRAANDALPQARNITNDTPQARSTANNAMPLTPGGCGAIPAGGGVTLKEAVETLCTESAALARVVQGQMGAREEQVLTARLPSLGAGRGPTLAALIHLAWAVNRSAYLKERLTLTWLLEGDNMANVIAGRYQDRRDPYEGRNCLSPDLVGDPDYFALDGYKGWLTGEPGCEFRLMVDGVARDCRGRTREEARGGGGAAREGGYAYA